MDEMTFIETIQDIGGSAYLVGGWVRDKVMGREPHDRDYVVCGVSEDTFVSRFPKAKKVGISFPVFILKIGGVPCEVAFARTEKKTGEGYKGFSVNSSAEITIEQDLYRRDTTMNSMAFSPLTGDIIDPYGGAEDIRNKTIRATSEHFLDDPVRALRAARQAAQFCFAIEHSTSLMMGQCARELAMESKERIVSELEKALGSPKPSLFFRALNESGLLEVVFPWISDLIGKTQPEEYHPEGDSFEHTMMVLDLVSGINCRVEVRFAALMHDIGKGATPYDMLPHHYGHEQRGLEVLREMNRVMTLPRRWYSCAAFAISEHMRPKRMTQPGKVVDMLIRLDKNPIGYDGFAAIIEADNGGEQADCLLNYGEYLSAIRGAVRVPIPEHLTGKRIGDWLRQREIEAYKKAVGAKSPK